MKAQIVYKLQDLAYQTQEQIPFRKGLVGEMIATVQELNREDFAVCQHLRYVEKFVDPASYQVLSYEDPLSAERGGAAGYELMHEPDFPVLRVGSRMVVPKEKFIQWVEEHTGGGE